MQIQDTHVSDRPQVEHREVIGFPGYRVGNDGSVWSRRPKNGRGPLEKEWRRLRPGKMSGYRVLCLRKPDGKRRNYCIHMLILIAFVGPPPPGMWALHKDDDKENNDLSNLYWGTPTDNARDRKANGHERPSRGEECYNAKLTEEQVVSIRHEAAAGATVGALAVKYGVSSETIGLVCNGKRWAHAGGPTLRLRSRPITRKTHCKNGHAMEGDNLRVMANGFRKCRACCREAAKRHKAALVVRSLDQLRDALAEAGYPEGKT